jgi:hypothetical protein
MDHLRNRSLAELFSDLGRDVSMLVRKEIELARAEMGRIAGTVARRAVFIAIGAVLCIAGLLSLVATMTLGVWQGLAALRSDSLVPTETIQTLKETGEILRAHAVNAPAVRAAHAPGA